jgi:gamma-glutamyltranspeptidase/glutathione hydrolase
MAYRGTVVARRGVVATAHPLATQAGVAMLRSGGSFMDAAVAAAAVLNVVEPYNSHLGGDLFLLAYTAADGAVTAINASGACPRSATPERFPNGIPPRHISAVTVPGMVDGWLTALARFGRKPLPEVLAAAIDYAENGFPANPRFAATVAGAAPELGGREAWAKVFLPDGRPPEVGQIVRQPDLARSLKAIAEGGRSAFYEGEIADAIVRYAGQRGGFLALQDFQDHSSELRDPISTTYRGYRVYEQPPVSQGHILLEELNILECFDIGALGPFSAAGVHIMVEAKKLAFADRHAYSGDHRFVDVPIQELISKEFANRRAAQIDPLRAAERPAAGALGTHGTDTTYLCVADSDGNAVSFIQSLFHGFGCGELVPGTGILLNNRLTGFSLDPTSPNYLQPGKRPIHTLNTFLITKDGRLSVVGGTPGGDVQVQTNLQTITCLIDANMDPQDVAEAPKWTSGDGLHVAMESRYPAETIEGMKQMGHKVTVGGPLTQGCAVQVIRVHPESGAYMAGSDPRCDGQAAGY